MKGRLLKVLDLGLARTLRWGSMVCLAGLWVLITAGVFVRFVPISSLGWADEIIELAFAWMVFLGTAALWRERTHFRVEIVPHLLAGSRAGRIVEWLTDLLCITFLSVFTYEAAFLTLRATDRSPILEYPKIIFYLAMPLTGAVMFGYSGRDLWRSVRGQST